MLSYLYIIILYNIHIIIIQAIHHEIQNDTCLRQLNNYAFMG